MARTHLLASVRRLLREHQLAQKTGLPIEEIRAGPYSTGGSSQVRTISRREFIAGVAATTAVAMLPSVLKGNSWAAAPPRLAIIGGGIAGLGGVRRQILHFHLGGITRRHVGIGQSRDQFIDRFVQVAGQA